MNTFHEDLRQIAGRLIDLHHDCRFANHKGTEYCLQCYPLLGMSEALMAQAGLVKGMEVSPVKSAGHIMNSKF